MTFEFKIQIRNITKPPVWRRLQVPAQFTFEEFHKVIQIVFEWDNYHLYNFTPQGWGSAPYIAVPSKHDDEAPDLDARKTVLSKLFRIKGQKFTYIYDFGDDWNHQITLEEILPAKTKKAVCINGNGAAAVEDCGGPWGYERLKEVLKNPKDEEYQEMLDWLGLESGDEWNTKEFNIEMINQFLKV
ncbi:MAG: plasmid pRiA4b ORF-3 family protein [Paludibacter sp.]|nr:plasmid pRiA4b ORF-3 family protein [Paludibacter sp.]